MGTLKQDFMWVRANEKGKNDVEVKDYNGEDDKRIKREDNGDKRNVKKVKQDKNSDPQTITWTRKTKTSDDGDYVTGCKDESAMADDMKMNGKW